MDLDKLQKFVETVKAGTITGGAEAMRMPKSSLSRQLSQLEQELNIKLLERQPRNFGTTEAGQRLFDQVEPLIAGLVEAEHDLEEFRTKPRGSLGIQVPTEFMGEDLSELCLEFLQDYPDIHMSITLYTGQIPLLPEKADVCFILHDSPLPDMDVIARPLVSFPQSIYASLQLNKIENLEDLELSRLILRSDESFWHFRSASNQRLSVATRPSIIMDSQDMRIQACMRGFGLTRFADYSVEALVRNGALHKVDLPRPMFALTLSVLYRYRRLPKKVQVFVEYIQSNIGSLRSRL